MSFTHLEDTYVCRNGDRRVVSSSFPPFQTFSYFFLRLSIFYMYPPTCVHLISFLTIFIKWKFFIIPYPTPRRRQCLPHHNVPMYNLVIILPMHIDIDICYRGILNYNIPIRRYITFDIIKLVKMEFLFINLRATATTVNEAQSPSL